MLTSRRLEQVRKRDRSQRALVAGAKDVPCADCGKRYPFYVMDLDHVRGDKKFVLGGSGYRNGRQRVIEEIAKCDVVCSNCHRERTHRREVEKAV